MAGLGTMGLLDGFDLFDWGVDKGTVELYIICIADEDEYWRDRPAHERIAPAQTPALLIEPDGAMDMWDENEEIWSWYATTGTDPELDSLDVSERRVPDR